MWLPTIGFSAVPLVMRERSSGDRGCACSPFRQLRVSGAASLAPMCSGGGAVLRNLRPEEAY